MRSSPSRGSPRATSRRASVAWACSALAALLAVTVSGPAHAKPFFGFELRLDRAQVWVDPAGIEYVGFPREDAERLLAFFEVRVPLVEAQLADHERLQALSRELVENERAVGSAERTRADTYQAIADGWRETARELRPTVWDRVFRAPELWFALGVLTATAVLVGIEVGL